MVWKKKYMVEDFVRYFYNLCEIFSVYNEIVVKCKVIYIEIYMSWFKYWLYIVYFGYDFMIC